MQSITCRNEKVNFGETLVRRCIRRAIKFRGCIQPAACNNSDTENARFYFRSGMFFLPPPLLPPRGIYGNPATFILLHRHNEELLPEVKRQRAQSGTYSL